MPTSVVNAVHTWLKIAVYQILAILILLKISQHLGQKLVVFSTIDGFKSAHEKSDCMGELECGGSKETP